MDSAQTLRSQRAFLKLAVVVVTCVQAIGAAPSPAYAVEAPPVLPSGIIAKPFPGPSGFIIDASAQNSFYVGGAPKRGDVCARAYRASLGKTTRVIHEEYGCDPEFTNYRFDQQTWTGSAIGVVETTKAVSTWKRSGGDWQRVTNAERESRALLKLRWKPNGPIKYDVGVPSVSLCYTLPVVCPSWRVAARRPMVIEGAIKFEGFSMSTKLPKRHSATAWLLAE